MQPIAFHNVEIDPQPFEALVGEDIVQFIFRHAPRKVATRVARALDHYSRAPRLIDIDESMGAIRLIAGEEELVVAIFEWLKINEGKYPEHKDFVRKFKNHVVKLSFYPVLQQFRFVLGDMIRDGFTFDGWESVISWKFKPVVDNDTLMLAITDNDGKEIIRHNPLMTMISGGGLYGEEVVPLLLADFEEQVREQRGTSLKGFLLERADFRNKLLYASDAGSLVMDDRLADLIALFNETYRDLLWVLAVLIGSQPPSNEWGFTSQFIALYRAVLIKAGVLRSDNTVDPAVER